MIADPYKVLGVDPGCTDTELKKAYREKSKKWHPDQNPDNTEYAEARFKEVQEAYDILSDEDIEYYIDNFKPFDKAGAYGPRARVISRAAVPAIRVMQITAVREPSTNTSISGSSIQNSRERRRARRPTRRERPAII